MLRRRLTTLSLLLRLRLAFAMFKKDYCFWLEETEEFKASLQFHQGSFDEQEACGKCTTTLSNLALHPAMSNPQATHSLFLSFSRIEKPEYMGDLGEPENAYVNYSEGDQVQDYVTYHPPNKRPRTVELEGRALCFSSASFRIERKQDFGL
ncbi:hypothetical protein O181_018728 [Austropuccinia psidii MF-1]|uniref:Uncharacterized protein n=1 Tax=Austropuccinia psidii MF-1 TaxID=1389203 RepID=A0A9Q3C8D0_9BASI|nr:hypothetical protein [Austropuccinia psidii MF-1]